MRRQNLAKAASDRAAAIVGDDPYLIDTIAVVYSRAGFHEDAIPLFKRAINLQQGQANMYYNLGASAQFVGDFELALDSYNKALKIDPNFYRAWASLVYLDKQSGKHNHLSELTELFAKNQDNSDAALQLGHAIAKTYEDIGDYERSLEWLLRAKESKRSELPYNRTEGAETYAAAKSTVSIEKESNVDGATNSRSSNIYLSIPIFIVGLPRTGTTLVDRILSSHSQVTSVGELNTFAELIKGESGSDSSLVLDADTLSNLRDIDFARVGQEYLERTTELARHLTFSTLA